MFPAATAALLVVRIVMLDPPSGKARGDLQRISVDSAVDWRKHSPPTKKALEVAQTCSSRRTGTSLHRLTAHLALTSFPASLKRRMLLLFSYR